MIMKLLHHIFLVWYCMNLLYSSIYMLWCTRRCRKMHSFLALADLGGIAPLPFLRVPISHTIGDPHKYHSGQRVLKPSKVFEGKPFQSYRSSPVSTVALIWEVRLTPLCQKLLFQCETMSWTSQGNPRPTEDSTVWHQGLRFDQVASRELALVLGCSWHLLSPEKPCSTDACDTDGNAASRWEDPPCMALYKTSSKVHAVLQRRREILKGKNVTEVNLNHMSDNSTGRTADISHQCACLISPVLEYFCCQSFCSSAGQPGGWTELLLADWSYGPLETVSNKNT